MASERLQARVEHHRADYERVVGRPFSHFYCPILRVDEDAPLCEGHVINEAFGTTNAWEPQRKDVDNFYGSMAEPEYINVIQHRGKEPFELWTDPDLRRRFRPKLTINDQRIEHYFPQNVRHVPGQTAGRVILPSGESTLLVIKEPQNRIAHLEGQELRIVVEGDFRPAVVASVLKAAHLTMFRLHGYHYVFSAYGLHLAGILGDFHLQNRDTEK